MIVTKPIKIPRTQCPLDQAKAEFPLEKENARAIKGVTNKWVKISFLILPFSGSLKNSLGPSSASERRRRCRSGVLCFNIFTSSRTQGVTVSVALPEIFPEAAVIVAVPGATAVARPVLLTVTTDILVDRQVTWEVISRLVPSE